MIYKYLCVCVKGRGEGEKENEQKENLHKSMFDISYIKTAEQNCGSSSQRISYGN